MEQLNGQNINVLPFKGLKKVADLIYFEGPILSHFQDEYKEDFLFYWVDTSESVNRWIVFEIEKKDLYAYFLNHKSLLDLFKNPKNNKFYSVEIGDHIEYKNIVLIYKEDLPDAYFPEAESYFKSQIPAVYDSKLEPIRETLLHEIMLDKALYLKAEPSNRTNSKFVAALDASAFLKGIGDSFDGLIDYATKQLFISKSITDNSRIAKATKTLKELFKPTIVKTSISSFAVGVSPNTIINSPDSQFTKEWLERIFSEFKNDVIDIDNKSFSEIEKVIERYNEDERIDIYDPLIKLYNNPNLKIEITDKYFIAKRDVKQIDKEKVDKILFKRKKESASPIEKFASVKVNPETNRPIGISGVTIFDQNITSGWSAAEIKLPEKTFVLTHTLTAIYMQSEGIHMIESNEYGIFASGESFEEAQLNFFEEFDFIYTRYNSLKDDELSDDVILIKRLLNRIVKEIHGA